MGRKRVDLTNRRFGNLVALECIGRSGGGKISWKCQCDCGSVTCTRTSRLLSGHTRSCGCLSGTSLKSRTGRVSLYKQHQREFRSWQAMRSRCLNESSDNFRLYGGRGITICEEWDSFETFLIDMGPRPDGHTLDRIDVNGNYNKSNCRWATPSQQSRNRRVNRYVEYNGERLCVAELAERVGMNANTLYIRLDDGLSIDGAVEEGRRRPKSKAKATLIDLDGKSVSLEDLSKRFDIKLSTLVSRLKNGWSVNEAITAPVVFRWYLTDDQSKWFRKRRTP
jgi:hypothetical protein